MPPPPAADGFPQLGQPAAAPPNGKPTAAAVVAASLQQKRAVGPAPSTVPPPGSAHTSLDGGEPRPDMSLDSLAAQLMHLGERAA